MADKVRVEAGNQLLTEMTAEEIAERTGEPVNRVLEDFMQSTTAEQIFNLNSNQRFYGPYELANEYLEEIGKHYLEIRSL